MTTHGIESWGFADGDGNEITRGWQGTRREAKVFAQVEATARNTTVEVWIEGDKNADGEPADSLFVVEPNVE